MPATSAVKETTSRRRAWLFSAILALGLVGWLGALMTAQEPEPPLQPIQAADDAERVARGIEQAWLAAIRKAAPSVVALAVERSADEPNEFPPGMFRNPAEDPAYRQRPAGAVSGVIISADGYILTSSFNVSGTIAAITVTLGDGRQFAGKVLGRNEVHDLGLVKVEAANLPVPAFREDTRQIRVGEFCAIIGRNDNASQHNASTGIISGVARQGMGAIQFDAQCNYGNTGGAVIDLHGRVLGIANTIRPNVTHGLNSGVCFGMPWFLCEADLPDLKRGVVVTKPKVPFLGIRPDADAVGVNGIRVAEVIPNTGAAAAGLRAGDVVTEVEGQAVATLGDLRKILQDKKVGDRVKITYSRAGRETTVTVTLGERP